MVLSGWWRRLPIFDRRHKAKNVPSDRRRLTISGEHRKLEDTTKLIIELANKETDSALDELGK